MYANRKTDVRAERTRDTLHDALRPRVAVVPAAGRGRRLDRLNTPKPLVEAGGTPLLVRTLVQLQQAGVERAVVVVGYREEAIRRALFRHPDLRLEITVVANPAWERGLVESVLCARDEVAEPFLLVMADHLYGEGMVAQALEVRLAPGQLCAVAGDPEGHRSAGGAPGPVRLVTQGDAVLDTGRNLAGADAVDAGLFVCQPELFGHLEQAARRGASDLCEALRPLARERRMGWWSVAGATWFDVDRPSDLILAEMALRRRRRPPRTAAAEAPPAPAADLYRFSTGAPTETEVVFQRGFVGDPGATAFLPASSAGSPIYLLTDTRVHALYGEVFAERLRAAGWNLRTLVLPEGEEAKTLTRYSALAEQILTEGIDERSVLVSLGGGVVCNVTGFLAATLYRGLGLVHVPTTVMAQCDAAISHKQAVNGARGKNQIGSYYPPRRIVVDVEVLSTLDDWRVPDGLAEVVKHGLAQDADLLELLLGHAGDPRDLDFLERVIRRTIELKCQLVSEDPKEEREGFVLHYGHTVGHAVEYLSGYTLGHGQAVAIGMMMAARVAHIIGACDEQTVQLHRQVLARLGLPTEVPPDIEVDAIIEMMRYDKRYRTEGIRVPLVTRPGALYRLEDQFAVPVSYQVLATALRGGGAHARIEGAA